MIYNSYATETVRHQFCVQKRQLFEEQKQIEIMREILEREQKAREHKYKQQIEMKKRKEIRARRGLGNMLEDHLIMNEYGNIQCAT